MPMAAMPAPMPVVPMPMVPAAMVMMMPADLFRLEVVDLVAGGDGRMSIRSRGQFCVFVEGMRREWRGLRTRCENRGARGNTKGDLEEIPTFHASFLVSGVQRLRHKFCGGDLNAR